MQATSHASGTQRPWTSRLNWRRGLRGAGLVTSCRPLRAASLLPGRACPLRWPRGCPERSGACSPGARIRSGSAVCGPPSRGCCRSGSRSSWGAAGLGLSGSTATPDREAGSQTARSASRGGRGVSSCSAVLPRDRWTISGLLAAPCACDHRSSISARKAERPWDRGREGPASAHHGGGGAAVGTAPARSGASGPSRGSLTPLTRGSSSPCTHFLPEIAR